MSAYATRTIKDTDYLCITAMLRARETNMVTRDKLERMLEEPDFAGACRIAAECGYPDMSGMRIREVEDTLSEHRHQEFEDVASMVPDVALLDLFRLKFDYHSAKALVKSNGVAKHLITYDGRGEASTILKYYMQQDVSMLPLPLGEAIKDSRSMLSRTGNPCLADNILDHAYYGELIDIAESTGLPFAVGYARLVVDTANLRTLIRARAAGKRPEIIHELLFEGGTVLRESLIEFTEATDALVQLFAPAGLETAAQKGVEVLSGGSMTDFERECDNAINAYLSDAERIGFGPEVVIAYLAAVENEVMSLRIVLTGKLMGIAPEILRERLRESYV